MSIGKSDFRGGVTTRTRVNAGEPAAMACVSGYDGGDGSLRPEGMVAKSHLRWGRHRSRRRLHTQVHPRREWWHETARGGWW